MTRLMRKNGIRRAAWVWTLALLLWNLPSLGLAEDAQPESDFDYASNTLRAEVWTDRAAGEVYRKGEDLVVSFETNRDAYAVVYRIDTEGLVTVLWPRSRFDDGFVFGGHAYELPVAGGRKLRVSTKEGQGVVEAVVSSYPFDLRSLELDFHHEHSADRYDFFVAGDPFLAMNEVNYAVTGLEDAADYVVTDYVDYYVHQEVDHPRYLCRQCHIDDDVDYDPYRDRCSLDIQSDYSWYNSWYDRYGYYPVYGNPAYVYIDPWTLNPWVNYWYQPAYACAPWFGWGWGWGAAYSWGYSPYYWGDSVAAYSGGYARYRPLDRTRWEVYPGGRTKTREYGRGSQMVRDSAISDRDRGVMASRTRGNAAAVRGQGRDSVYRGVSPVSRPRQRFEGVVVRGSSQGGLRIRQPAGNTVVQGSATVAGRRHTAAGAGRSPSLVRVGQRSPDTNDWRGTTRGGSSTPITVGHGRTVGNAGVTTGQSVQAKPRHQGKKPTRVWRTNDRTGSARREPTRSRGRAVGHRKKPSTERATPTKPRVNTPQKDKKGAARSSGKTAPKAKPSSRSRGREPVSHGGASRSSGSHSTGRRSGGSRR